MRSARAGSPTDWILRSYWSVQKYGTASYGTRSRGRGEQVARRVGALLGGVRPVLDPDHAAVGHRVRPRRGVAGREDVLGVARGERRVADDARLQLEPGLHEPVGVGDRAEGDHGHVGGDARAVGEPHRLEPAVPLEPVDARREPQVDAVRAVQLGDALADILPERGNGLRRDVDQRDVEPALARGRGDLAADEAGADDREPRAPLEVRPQRERVVDAAQRVHAVELDRIARPVPRARAGRDDQLVVAEPLVAHDQLARDRDPGRSR